MDMKRIWILCLIYIIGVCDNSYAEEVDARTVTLSLTDAIRLAQIQSVDAAVALNELKTAYWEYRTHKAEQLPEIISPAHCLRIANNTPNINSRMDLIRMYRIMS